LAEKTYSDPNVRINRVYTRGGDKGQTSLIGGRRVPKDSLRIEAYGTVDELSAFVGLGLASSKSLSCDVGEMTLLTDVLLRVQHELFNLGTMLASTDENLHPSQPHLSDLDVDGLERDMDRVTALLAELRSFVLPGASRLSAELHVCRTVCRRAERLCVKLQRQDRVPELAIAYVNRLSDLFFVLSRWADQLQGLDETLWDPNRATSAAISQPAERLGLPSKG
jgi:cob(I)alamin adenosyltransferase